MRAGVTALLVAALGCPASAQPTTGQPTTPARELYKAAEQAMDEGRYTAAVADYTKAYELSSQPALLFKIASAHHKAGSCDVALDYYGRYLREGAPEPKFVELTRQRITECGGDPDKLAAPPAPPPVEVAPVEQPPEVVVETRPAPPAQPPPPQDPPATGRHATAWLVVGGSIAMLTIGSVLGYSAEAAESDITDLYIGLDGRSPRYDDRTRERYDNLVAEGERYERLSWISFGVAGALGVTAAVLFWRGRVEAAPTRVAPRLSPRGAGVVVRF